MVMNWQQYLVFVDDDDGHDDDRRMFGGFFLVPFKKYPRENVSGCHSLMVGARVMFPAIFMELFQDFYSGHDGGGSARSSESGCHGGFV